MLGSTMSLTRWKYSVVTPGTILSNTCANAYSGRAKNRCTSTTISAEFSGSIVTGAWSLIRPSSYSFSLSVNAIAIDVAAFLCKRVSTGRASRQTESLTLKPKESGVAVGQHYGCQGQQALGDEHQTDPLNRTDPSRN